MHRNRNPCNSFFTVNMASAMDHGRLGPTTTTTTTTTNYGESGARKRRWNNTEHCHEAKLTWAIGKEAFKYPTTQMTTDLAFPSLKFARQDAVQPCKKSYMIRWSQENSNVSVCSVKLQNSKHSGKKCGWFLDQSKRILKVQSSQLLHQVSAWRKIQSWPK